MAQLDGKRNFILALSPPLTPALFEFNSPLACLRSKGSAGWLMPLTELKEL